MDKDKIPLATVMQGITNISMLGLSVIVPIVLCALLASVLKEKLNIPDWAMMIIILLGVGAGINSFVSFAKAYLKKIDSKDKGADK